MNDRAGWNERYAAGHGPKAPNARLAKYVHRLRPGLALDLAAGVGQNAHLLKEHTVVLVDISDAALALASGLRVVADAAALPFPAETFDAITCTYFFEPRVDFGALLKQGGTLFFETYSAADIRYRPDFPAAFRFDPADIPSVFRNLKTELWEETDDGSRVVGTFIGSKI
jgi:SAM-dependent methyltransferase